jgi:tetratricopeptide (TPR) repeat protein
MKKKIFFIIMMILLTCLSLLSNENEENRGEPIRIKVPNLEDGGYVGDQYLVLIAINRYRNEFWPSLQYPVDDAKEFKKILQASYNYKNENIKELYDDEATLEKIIEYLEGLQTILKRDDSLLIFFLGHGSLGESSDSGYWIPVDGGRVELDRWITHTYIKGIIKKMESRHILIISDSCFAGSMLDISRSSTPVIKNDYYRKLYSHRCRQVMTSGARRERVPDRSEFAEKLKSALIENSEFYMDGMMLFVKSRNVSQTQPLFGGIADSKHEPEAGFLFFSNKASKNWEIWLENFKKAFDEAKEFDKENINISKEKVIQKLQQLFNLYWENDPFSTKDEEMRDYIIQRLEEIKGGPPPSKKEDDKSFEMARKKNTSGSYEKYLADYPNGNHRAEAYYNCGVIYFKVGQYNKALTNFSIAIKSNSNDVDAYNNGALCYTMLGDYDNAIKYYSEAIKKYSSYKKIPIKKLALVYTNRGIYYCKKGDNEAAKQDYNKAIELDKKNGDAYYNRGILYLELTGQDNLEPKKRDELIEQAITDFKSAINCNKKDLDAYEKLAQSYEKIGSIKEAQKTRAKAQKMKSKK